MIAARHDVNRRAREAESWASGGNPEPTIPDLEGYGLGESAAAIASTARSIQTNLSFFRLLLTHMHDAGHERMHGADVGEVAFAGERVLELVVGIQAFRGEALVVAGHGMRRLVM